MSFARHLNRRSHKLTSDPLGLVAYSVFLVERIVRYLEKRRARILATFLLLICWPVSYSALVLGLILLSLLVITGRVEVKGREHIPHYLRPLLILSNHPSYWETYLLPFIFGWRSLWTALLPWSTPAMENFKHWAWFWAWPRFIPFPRGKRGILQAIAKVKRVLSRRGRVIVFPEGGRTSSDHRLMFDLGHGRKMRPLKNGAARVIYHTGAPVLLIWIQGSDEVCPCDRRFPRLWDLLTKKTTITIGRTITMPTPLFHREVLRQGGSPEGAVDQIDQILSGGFFELARSVQTEETRTQSGVKLAQ